MAVASKQSKKLKLTVSDCDAELRRYGKQLRELLAADDDREGMAVCRYQIDRWLDRRLLLTSAAEEWSR